MQKQAISKIDILHADIQGYEVEMLQSCSKSLASRTIDFLFISTHSQELHDGTIDLLRRSDYRIDISADVDEGTTSFDGFVLAASPAIKPLFSGFTPLPRVQLAQTQPDALVDYLSETIQALRNRS